VFAVSWVFLAVAVVALLLGLSREGLLLIYVSIGASVAAMVFLLAGVLRRPDGSS
jgi:low affinity Fe/Cu permease